MSAFVVLKVHIDALLTAGLKLPWFERARVYPITSVPCSGRHPVPVVEPVSRAGAGRRGLTLDAFRFIA